MLLKYIKFYALLLTLLPMCNLEASTDDKVIVDFESAEKTIEWLSYIKTESDPIKIKQYFFKHVAPTKGTQSIINHWSRFKVWNNEELYKFIMLALDRLPEGESLSFRIPDYFEANKHYWQDALNHPENIKRDIKQLKKLQLERSGLINAKQNLPDDIAVDVDFYFVLFGASTAFAVGKENGMDILQLPRLPSGELNLDVIQRTIAHEMHHNGFNHSIKKHMPQNINTDNLALIGVMAAEGTATYFNQNPTQRFLGEKMLNKGIDQEIKIWQKKLKNQNYLFQKAQRDLKTNLEGAYDQNKIYSEWLSGYTGDAYIVGTVMVKIIVQELGHDAAMMIIKDYRKFISLYNKAAKMANEKGQKQFVFTSALAIGLLNYKD